MGRTAVFPAELASPGIAVKTAVRPHPIRTLCEKVRPRFSRVGNRSIVFRDRDVMQRHPVGRYGVRILPQVNSNIQSARVNA